MYNKNLSLLHEPRIMITFILVNINKHNLINRKDRDDGLIVFILNP